MAKQVVYFNATKQIETVIIHYNNKLDESFVADVCNYIKEIAKNMKKVNLKEPRDYYLIKVFLYPSAKLFNEIFGGVIEKRYYNRKRSLEDLYIVQDSEGNIHMVSPRGKSPEKVETLKKILVMKILGEYMEDKDKEMAQKMLKAAMLKKKEKEEKEVEEPEEPEENIDEPEEEEKEEEEKLDELEEEQEEVNEEELEELIEAEDELAEIDESEEDEAKEPIEQEDKKKNKEEKKQEEKEEGEIPNKVVEAREWLNIGWIRYLSGRLTKEKYVKYFAEHISKKGVKKLGKLKDSAWYEKYNYAQEFATAIVEYIIVTYGVKRLIMFYENPTDYKHVFGTSKLRFEQQAKAYIYSKYGPAKMKEEIESREIEEITQVKPNDIGGAEITTISEEDEERSIGTAFLLSLDDKI